MTWMLVIRSWNQASSSFAVQIAPVTHDPFPSGPWTGFYNYSPKKKHRMNLDLTLTAATGISI
jgi:hypothetical protein